MVDFIENRAGRGLRGWKMTHDNQTGIIFSEPGDEVEMKTLAKSLLGRGGGGGLEEVANPADPKGVAYKGTVPQIKNLGTRLEMRGFPQDRVARARGTALIAEPAA